MCTPAAAFIMSAAGTAISLYGQYQTKQYNEQVAEVNQRNLNVESAARRDAGAISAARIRERASRLAAEQTTSFISAGVNPFSGSAADIIAGTVSGGELDALQEEHNTAMGIFGIQTRSNALRAEAQLQNMRANYGMGTSLLTSASALYDQGKTAKFWS